MNTREGAIILVDDEAEVLDTVEKMLSTNGFKVRSASDGAQAMILLNDDPNVDFLLTDINMPTIDGYMLADMVKVHKPSVSVLYMTGVHVHPPREQGVCHGPTILKPFRAADIVAAVQLRRAAQVAFEIHQKVFPRAFATRA